MTGSINVASGITKKSALLWTVSVNSSIKAVLMCHFNDAIMLFNPNF